MGMFDRVLPDANLVIDKCPKCKHKFNIFEQEWQTKSYKNLLFNVSLRTLRHEVGNFELHTICEHCDTYIKVEFSDKNNSLVLKYKNNNDKTILKNLNNKQIELFKALSEDEEGLHYNFGGIEDEDI